MPVHHCAVPFWLAIVAAWTPAVAADSLPDAERLLDEGIGTFDEGCAQIAKSEASEPGLVEQPYLLACNITLKEPNQTGAGNADQAATLLLKQGRESLDRACLKFTESYQSKPTPFALLLMSNCDFIKGQTVSARDKCLKAHDLSSRKTNECAAQVPAPDSKRDEECREAKALGERAERCIMSLEPKLPHATIEQNLIVPQENTKRVAIPKPEKSELVVSSSGALPWVLGGVGAASLVTGSVFGILALKSNRQLVDNCPDQQCTEDMLRTQDQRDAQARVANVAIGVGVAGLGTAAVWLWLSGRGSRQSEVAARGIRLEAEPARGGAALWVKGRF